MKRQSRKRWPFLTFTEADLFLLVEDLPAAEGDALMTAFIADPQGGRVAEAACGMAVMETLRQTFEVWRIERELQDELSRYPDCGGSGYYRDEFCGCNGDC